MGLAGWIAVFAVSLVALLFSARGFTRAAEVIGRALGMSAFAVGAAIVSVGTSLPELVSASIAVSRGAPGIVGGNVVGAGLSNIFLVLGISTLAARKTLQLGSGYILVDLHFLVGSALILAVCALDGAITPVEAGFALAVYGVYMYYLLRESGDPGESPASQEPQAQRVTASIVALAIVCPVIIYFSADWTVASIREIALRAGVTPAIVSLTLLSLGTSLPETVVSATAARQGKGDIAVGNVLGSCVFNSLAVVGTARVFGQLPVAREVLAFPLPLYVAAALLFYLLTQDKRVSRWEGMLFVALYFLFFAKVVGLA